MRIATVFWSCSLAALGLGCRPGSSISLPSEVRDGSPWFRDVTRERGLDFVHDAGSPGAYFLPQLMGSGAALFDFNGDGHLDIYLLQNGGPQSGSVNRLYQQMDDGHFKDVSKGSGLDIAGYNMGVAVGDINNDGWPDLLVTQYGGVKLFLNNGNGTFRDITREAGLDNPLWGASAVFFDYDRDGWLDLVLVNYLDYSPSRQCGGAGGTRDYCNPNEFAGTVTRLFHNRGIPAGAKARAVRFDDATASSGLARKAGPGLGVLCADFNGDGWPDIFVTNDGRPNHLWINQKDSTFREEALSRGLAFNGMGNAPANMGIALGDVDGDNLFDVFVTHLTSETHALWRQGPRGLFLDRAAAAGLAGADCRGTGFGTILEDFNGDGALDLAIANGRVIRAKASAAASPDRFWEPYAEPNHLFAGDGAGHFRNLTHENTPFCGTAGVFRGLACGDVDGDGAVDLLVTQVAGPARLFRNVVSPRGHWLGIRVFDPALKRDAYGAEVTVQTTSGRQRRWVNAGASYLCSHDPRISFGLGTASRVESIQVRWPDGKEEIFAGRAADQWITLRKGGG